MSRRKTSSTNITHPTGDIRKYGVIRRQHDDWEWATYEGYLDNVIWIRRIAKLDLDDIWI